MAQQTTVAPMLSVRRGAKAVEFYKAAFGVRELFRIENQKGEVVARLAVSGADAAGNAAVVGAEAGTGQAAEFWVADESPEHKNFSPETLGGGTVRMVLAVSDPDAMFARAVRAGAQVVSAMADQHGWRVGRVVDPFGHHWEIGKEG